MKRNLLDERWFWVFLGFSYLLALWFTISEQNWWALVWLVMAGALQILTIVYGRLCDDMIKTNKEILDGWGETLKNQEELIDLTFRQDKMKADIKNGNKQ